ncbi:MAG: glycosyltransferase family 39 protein [Candidatus Saccharibacteria bacterium]|nr:glycosyltransferase family 39 protein [Candidatus Saccharibacteria bacterium]
MTKPKISTVIRDRWQSVVLALVALVGLFGVFFYQFGTIAPSVRPEELNVLGSGLSDILRSPLHLHQQIVQKVATLLGASDLLAVRLTPAINAVISVGAFYLIVRSWFTRRIALMGSALFLSSSWLLHTARMGTTDANYLLIVVPVLALTMLLKNKFSLRGSILLLLSGIVLLYVPGFIWLVVPALILRRKLIIDSVRVLPPWAIGLVSLCVVFGLLPLVVAATADPRFLWEITGLPSDFSRLSEVPASLVEGLKALFVAREFNPLFGIGTLAYLNIATMALIVLGMAQSYRERRLERNKALAIICLVGVVLHGLSLGAISLAFVMPFLFMYATKGLAYLLQNWRAVFPKNFLAEKLAVVALIAVLVGIGTYETIRYFEAWPHSDGYAEIFKTTDT